ncbi:hypothetical protein RCH19_002504 [Flavobacterium sp. PL12]
MRLKYKKKGVEIHRYLLLFMCQFIRKTFSVPSFLGATFSN